MTSAATTAHTCRINGSACQACAEIVASAARGLSRGPKGLPSWMRPRTELSRKSWPEWTQVERSSAPNGLVWDRDAQRWA